MHSTTPVERPEAALDVASRYSSRERPLDALVTLVVVAVFVATWLATSLVPAAAVAAVLVVLARAPVLRSRGSVRLRTDEDPESVVDEFAGPTPPVLAFQWGVADEVSARARGDARRVTYRFTYLLGLRSVEMTVHTHREESADVDRRVVLEVETSGRPWGTYEVAIDSDGDETTVDVEYASDRRFGLRRLPQYLVAARYRDEALRAQGYEVVEREGHFGV